MNFFQFAGRITLGLLHIVYASLCLIYTLLRSVTMVALTPIFILEQLGRGNHWTDGLDGLAPNASLNKNIWSPPPFAKLPGISTLVSVPIKRATRPITSTRKRHLGRVKRAK